jgi:hypothetical protein
MGLISGWSTSAEIETVKWFRAERVLQYQWCGLSSLLRLAEEVDDSVNCGGAYPRMSHVGS